MDERGHAEDALALAPRTLLRGHRLDDELVRGLRVDAYLRTRQRRIDQRDIGFILLRAARISRARSGANFAINEVSCFPGDPAVPDAGRVVGLREALVRGVAISPPL